MNETQHANIFQNSLWGAFRGALVDILVHPLDVLKTQQQCTPSEKCTTIAKRLFQQSGYKAFYQGLTSQLARTSIKQSWCWPMIIHIPPLLREKNLSPIHVQIITGVLIASVDAFVTTPLERQKITAMLAQKKPFSLEDIYKHGWQGLKTYWMKRSINMTTFLLAQEYFRKKNRKDGSKLSRLGLIKTGAQVAFFVSLVGAPFDMANTLKQACSIDISLFSQKIMPLYRGWPLYAASLIIHNIASVILIENLTKPDRHP